MPPNSIPRELELTPASSSPFSGRVFTTSTLPGLIRTGWISMPGLPLNPVPFQVTYTTEIVFSPFVKQELR